MSKIRLTKFGILLLLAWLTFASCITSPHIIGEFNESRNSEFTVAAPTISSPPDRVYDNGTLGARIVWEASDPNPKNFTITRDDDVYRTTTWDGGPLTVFLNHLYPEGFLESLPASFIFVCTVENEQREKASDEVNITFIADERAPIIAQPENITYEEGSFGWEIKWNITEANPDIYNITRVSNEPTSNETVIESGDLEADAAVANITVNVDGLNASRWYVYTIFVNDTFGRNSTSSVNVSVYEDLTSPTVSSPDDISYEFGADDQAVSWKVYDSNPQNYTITIYIQNVNDTYGNLSIAHLPGNITQADWTLTNPKGDDVSVNIEDIFVGNYTFNITLFDDFGFSATDSLNVTVYEDIRAPVVNASDDLSYEEGHTGYFLNWTAEETNPLTYNLTLDGEVLMNGTWRGESFNISVDGLAVGAHVYNMTLKDFFNQSSIVPITVTVTPDAHLPIIAEVFVIQSFTTQTSSNISVQAYVWDLNRVKEIKISWYKGNSNANETKDMSPQGDDFYLAHLGEYSTGDEVWYRVVATDNSSVSNVFDTGWRKYIVESLIRESTPITVYAVVLTLGMMAAIVVIAIYFKTKTK